MTEDFFDHRLLNTFVRVAEAQTISRGAVRVNRTQSSVSAQIQRLEEDAGARLFERGARRLALTAEGERLLGLAREVLDANRRAVALLRERSAPVPLRLGCSQYWRPRDLPALVGRVRGAFPGYALEFTVASSEELARRVEAETLDVAVVSSVKSVPGGRLLHREPLVWAAAREFRVPAAGPLPLVLLGSECHLRRVALAALAKARREARVVLASTSAVGIQAALEASVGIGCLNVGALPPALAVLEGAGLPRLPALGFHAIARARDAGWRRVIEEFAGPPAGASGPRSRPGRHDGR